MAERIVSPGVFTRERDLSFLPQAIGEIGAAIIGPTKKGPAFTPTQISNYQEFEQMFGGVDRRFYTPYTVEQYLRSAGVVTVVRVLGLGGYAADVLELVAYSTLVSSSLKSGVTGEVVTNTSQTHSIAILAPSRGGGSGTGDLTAATASSAGVTTTNTNASDHDAVAGSWTKFGLRVTGSDVTVENYTLSFDTSSGAFIDKQISPDPQSTKAGTSDSSVYVYKVWKKHADLIGSIDSLCSASVVVHQGASGTGLDFSNGATSFDAKGNASSFTGNVAYSFARTPMIQSQDPTGTFPNTDTANRYDLFRVYSRSHGSDINKSYKVNILNIKPAADVAGSDYGTFSLQVRVHNSEAGATDNDNILEQFDALTFDPNSPNFFAKRIGDRWVEIDSDGKLTYYGDHPNLSKYIRVGDYADMVEDGVFRYPKGSMPMGFKSIRNTVPGGTQIPSASFKSDQKNTSGDFDQTIFHGFDFSNIDNHQYLGPIPNAATDGNNKLFSLQNMFGHDDASGSVLSGTAAANHLGLTGSAAQQLKFTIPLQWGFDGYNPANPYSVGNDISTTNTQGFDLSSTTAGGTRAYKRAINAVSNPDEFDINLLVTPGVLHSIHSAVTNHAISKVEARADAFYVMDAAAYGDTIATTKSTVKTLDTNYAGVYYPWIKIVDRDTNSPVWVPPSVVIPGVISYTDQVAHEWFAPAGLNRGGLTTVLEAKTRLTHSERDDLYENRINPIASFPGQGVVVFGQKTLQSKPSALDRINVRRLLIAVRKFIASSSRYLVFEQNTQALRNRFLNIVNPYLEQVQQNSGLSAFRVVMDDSNNTPDVVDRNQLVGQIFIQPTRTAEFIVLDFVVLPTGATFPA